ncbi:urate hydroxylase PuuD [bacterium]|nr:urate hydroxylase PuuD [bacterium]
MLGPFEEWLGILLRWIHVITAIMWIGDSLLFMWLDNHMYEDPEKRPYVTGITWLIHGGSYYTVEKRPLKAGKLPPRLRWFWMEATGTWISGFLLLMVVYWLSAGTYMVDPGVRELSAAQAIGVSLGSILGSWFLYDGLWRTPLRNHTLVCGSITLAYLFGLDWWLTHTLSGRAAFLQMGAVMASLMAFNVWIHIIPPQRKMYLSAAGGGEVDYSLGKHAKYRSTHNTYFTFPVIFLMLSNHFAGIFGHPLNWLLMALFIIFGAGMRHLFLVGLTRAGKIAGAAAAMATAAIFYVTWPAPKPPAATSNAGDAPPFSEIRVIIAQRCAVCHSESPGMGFSEAPKGLKLDSPHDIVEAAERIKLQAVDRQVMPLGNATKMTPEEREKLGRWIDAGCPLK